MVLKLLKNLFGGPEETAATQTVQLPEPGIANAAGLIEYLVKSLAATINDVRVETVEDDKGMVIGVHCHKDDMGRIIGKNGKTIGAIRHLATDAAARQKIRIRKIEVVEP